METGLGRGGGGVKEGGGGLCVYWQMGGCFGVLWWCTVFGLRDRGGGAGAMIGRSNVGVNWAMTAR